MINLENDKIKDQDMFDVYEDNEDTQANKFLSFRIDQESYGISIKHIIEIIELQKITSVPDMPGFVKGVINLRGKVIPVIDLRIRFSFEQRDYDDRTCIIVNEINGTTIGFIVDTVEEVVEIKEDHIEPAPEFKTSNVKDKYVSGLGKIGDKVKILLDVKKILFEEELEALKQTG